MRNNMYKNFEGNINGVIYNDPVEFNKALITSGFDMDEDLIVSYKFVASQDNIEKDKEEPKYISDDTLKYVPESRYIKNVDSESDTLIDDELSEKLKCASNKSEISRNICKRIKDFDSKIESNLLYINELKSDVEKLNEKISSINSQIETFQCANNNYYLNKKYYININDLLEYSGEEISKEKENSCNCGSECKCKEKNKIEDNDTIRVKMDSFDELVEYFLKN